MQLIKNYLIGGFLLNDYPFTDLNNKFQLNYQFIDINQFSPQTAIKYLEQLIVNEKQINLIAYSLGGLLALHLTLNYSVKIKRLILINSSPCFLESINWAGISVASFNNLYLKAKTLNHKQFANYFLTLAALPDKIKAKELYLSPYINSKFSLAWLIFLAQSDYRQSLNQLNLNNTWWLNAKEDSIIPKQTINANYINTTHLELNLLDITKYLC